MYKRQGNIWTAETIERPDTDILYYDLDSLEVISVAVSYTHLGKQRCYYFNPVSDGFRGKLMKNTTIKDSTGTWTCLLYTSRCV